MRLTRSGQAGLGVRLGAMTEDEYYLASKVVLFDEIGILRGQPPSYRDQRLGQAALLSAPRTCSLNPHPYYTGYVIDRGNESLTPAWFEVFDDRGQFIMCFATRGGLGRFFTMRHSVIRKLAEPLIDPATLMP